LLFEKKLKRDFITGNLAFFLWKFQYVLKLINDKSYERYFRKHSIGQHFGKISGSDFVKYSCIVEKILIFKHLNYNKEHNKKK